MTAPAVEFVDISRDYSLGLWPRRTLRAVDRINLRIEPGEVFGLLGPNRACKTTLVKMLLSLCRPTSIPANTDTPKSRCISVPALSEDILLQT